MPHEFTPAKPRGAYICADTDRKAMVVRYKDGGGRKKQMSFRIENTELESSIEAARVAAQAWLDKLEAA